MSFTEDVTYYRAALLLGVHTPEEVSEWAEAAFAAEDAPPRVLMDAVMAPRELTALRTALAPAALEPEPPTVVLRLLARVAADVDDGRRSVDDTVHVFAQMRRMIALPADVARVLAELESAYQLAIAGVEGDVAVVRERIATWLVTCTDPARAT